MPAFGQGPEILHYTFDTGAVVNTAMPGTGATEVVTDVSFITSTSCGSTGLIGDSQATTTGIATNWQVDLGTSDWSVGMIVDLTAGTNDFQYFFGSQTASAFRCFSKGVAGTDGIMLRSPGGDITIPGATVEGAPRHIVFVYDSKVPEIRGYVDGVLTATEPQNTMIDLTGTSPDFTVMRHTLAMKPLNTMEEFRFYCRAISVAEIVDWGTCGGSTGGLGTNYCMANANSTGVAAAISATGSAIVAANNMTLTATNLRLNAFGFFLASTTSDFVPNPAGSSGNLCLGGAIGRYVGPGQIKNAGADGEFSLAIDLANVPQPNGGVPVMAGETWHFQAWNRDFVGGMTTSNFTDGLEVAFM